MRFWRPGLPRDPASDTELPTTAAPAEPAPTPATEAPAPASQGGWLGRLRAGLSRSSNRLNEGINTIFGIPDPNFVHLFHLADERGWNVVAPHQEASAGFMAEAVSRMTGGPGLCIGTLGPGMANIAGAMMCALVENSPVIFLGGQRARITERRVRRGRIQFVQQEGLFTPSVKYSSSIE